MRSKSDEVAYIIGDFGQHVEQELLEIAKSQGAKGSIYHQDVALGTAHAILCAKESLEGPVVVAFADTLFRADFSLDTASDGVIWTKKVEDPRQFGVVQKNSEGVITDFVEKPQEFVSDEAIIGIYYFGDGANLRSELQYLIDNDIKDKGEYQITDALENMKAKGKRFTSGTVNEWMDCGNKNITVDTNSKILNSSRTKRISRPVTSCWKTARSIRPALSAQGLFCAIVKLALAFPLEEEAVLKTFRSNTASLVRSPNSAMYVSSNP